MKRHTFFHFLVLVILLAGGVSAFYIARSDVTLQLIVGITTAVLYILWGIIHHALLGDLHHKIMIEYMLIGAIAIVLLVTILGF